jgi:hypothetical protein
MSHFHEEEDEYESIPNSTLGVSMLAGAIAGITEHVVTYPLDVLKVFNSTLTLDKNTILQCKATLRFNSDNNSEYIFDRRFQISVEGSKFNIFGCWACTCIIFWFI